MKFSSPHPVLFAKIFPMKNYYIYDQTEIKNYFFHPCQEVLTFIYFWREN